MDERATIAAISTAPGRGGVAVVRVSGPDALAIASALAGRAAGPGRRFFHVVLRHRGRILDDGIVLVFRAPASYTGEDVVEFQTHGGTMAPRRVLDACLECGARLARRGEFTQRAFLNGRIGFSEAEAVIDLIDAKTERAAADAAARLDGAENRANAELYERALDLSARLEHALDVSEDELPSSYLAETESAVDGLLRDVAAAARRLREGKILREGALVVLAGPPNAGKSSLLNALLGEQRAIVSDVAGTTRDSIEEWLDIDGWPVRLVDTAGIREAGDAIEAEGVRRAEELVACADVVVALDADLPGSLRIHSKCDISRGEDLNVSAKTGEGLDALRSAIAARLAEKADTGGTGAIPSKAETGLDALLAAGEALRLARDGLPDVVLAANGVRKAADHLGRLAGRVYSDDLLENLFSRFCVGK